MYGDRGGDVVCSLTIKFMRITPRLALLGVLLLVACGEAGEDFVSDGLEQRTDPQAELRRFILAASAPPLATEQTPQQTGEDKDVKSEGGAVTECSFKRFTGTALYETLVSFDPNADSIWPGSVIQTTTLPEGIAAPIAVARRPGTITVGDAVIGADKADVKYSRTLPKPTLAATRDAVSEIFANQKVQLPAKSNYLAETAYSMNEAALKLGVSAKWMTGSMKASFGAEWITKKTTMVVRFVQAYYTVSFEAPAAPEKLFAPDVTVADVRAYMGPGNPPAYVSSVTYGRMMLMKIESDESEADLRATLDVTYNKVSGSLDAKSSNILKNSSISVFVLGGSADAAAKLQSASAESRAAALASYIQSGANYDPASPGVPISYTVRRLSDNATIKVASTIDYQIPVCVPAALQLTLDFDKISVGSSGQASNHANAGEYEVWMESTDSQGGALPPTAGANDTSRRQTVVKGTASFEGGGQVVLAKKQLLTVNKRQGAGFTVGAHVKTSANNKQCDMTRSHEYRFNPKTLVGEWTNVGTNTISCEDGDSAWFGNNALRVSLGYKLTP